ncbi:MAG: hypothetical protein AAF772_03715 [Acidobacteriota bacterium]
MIESSSRRVSTRILAAFNVLLLVGAACAVLLAAYGAAQLRARPLDYGVAFVLYAAAPLLVVAVLIGVRLLPVAARINAVLLLVSVGVMLGLAELAVTLLPSPRPETTHQRMARQLGQPYDGRTVREVVADARARGEDVWPFVSPGHFLARDLRLDVDGARILPLSAGLPGRTLVDCNEGGRYTIYPANAWGFRGPLSTAETPAQLVLLGDSFTQGACVDDGETLADHLRMTWPRTVNLGASGTGPLMQLGILQEFAARLRPARVLWFFYEGNDLANVQWEYDAPIVNRYLRDGAHQALLDRRTGVEAALVQHIDAALARPVAARKRKAWRDWLLLGSLRGRLGWFSDRSTKRPLDRTAVAKLVEVFDRGRTVAASWGGQVTIVYLPSWERYGAPNQAFAPRRAVLRALRARGFDVVDVHPVFRAHHDPLSLFPMRIYGHYNADGYARAADAVRSALQRATTAADDRAAPAGWNAKNPG